MEYKDAGNAAQNKIIEAQDKTIESNRATLAKLNTKVNVHEEAREKFEERIKVLEDELEAASDLVTKQKTDMSRLSARAGGLETDLKNLKEERKKEEEAFINSDDHLAVSQAEVRRLKADAAEQQKTIKKLQKEVKSQKNLADRASDAKKSALAKKTQTTQKLTEERDAAHQKLNRLPENVQSALLNAVTAQLKNASVAAAVVEEDDGIKKDGPDTRGKRKRDEGEIAEERGLKNKKKKGSRH